MAADERAQLIAAAERVLARSGWWGFKVESVLREARLSTRSLYRHFESKEELGAALLEETLIKIADAVTDVVDPPAQPVNRVRTYIDSLIGWAFDPDFAKPALMFATNWRALLPVYPDLISRCLDAFTAPLVEALEEGTRDGVLDSPDPRADARTVFCLVSGVLFDIPRDDDDSARREVEYLVMSFVNRALLVAGRSS
jgi:AcrR family transcriptional regulator